MYCCNKLQRIATKKEIFVAAVKKPIKIKLNITFNVIEHNV